MNYMISYKPFTFTRREFEAIQRENRQSGDRKLHAPERRRPKRISKKLRKRYGAQHYCDAYRCFEMQVKQRARPGKLEREVVRLHRDAFDNSNEKRFVTRVVHRSQPYDVYIGRSSKWGNPFSHLPGTLAKHRVASRAEAIAAYERYIQTRPDLIAAAKVELRGKTLGCWCSPRACHGDILARIADEQ